MSCHKNALKIDLICLEAKLNALQTLLTVKFVALSRVLIDTTPGPVFLAGNGVVHVHVPVDTEDV